MLYKINKSVKRLNPVFSLVVKSQGVVRNRLNLQSNLKQALLLHVAAPGRCILDPKRCL